MLVKILFTDFARSQIWNAPVKMCRNFIKKASKWLETLLSIVPPDIDMIPETRLADEFTDSLSPSSSI